MGLLNDEHHVKIAGTDVVVAAKSGLSPNEVAVVHDGEEIVRFTGFLV